MIKLNTTNLTRKVALGLGAIVVSTMTLAGANQAQAKVSIDLHFGGWGWGGPGVYHGPHYGPGYWGPSCYYFKKKWFKTGKFRWKKKYYKCMGWW